MFWFVSLSWEFIERFILSNFPAKDDDEISI